MLAVCSVLHMCGAYVDVCCAIVSVLCYGDLCCACREVVGLSVNGQSDTDIRSPQQLSSESAEEFQRAHGGWLFLCARLLP